jgi:hypothetical protein
MIQSFKNCLPSFSVRQVQDQWATLTSLEQRDLIIKIVAAAAFLSLIAVMTAYVWPTRSCLEVKKTEPVKKIGVLRGQIDSQGGLQGLGARRFPEGSEIEEEEGTFEDSILIQGRRKYYNGQLHEGTFKEGQLASGSITFPDKEIWSGHFKDGQLKGEDGMKNLSECKRNPPIDEHDPLVLTGYFEAGQLVRGKITTQSGIAMTGTFDKRGNLQGAEGRIDHPKTSPILFEEGEFLDNELHGKGKRQFRNRAVQVGSFERGNFLTTS